MSTTKKVERERFLTTITDDAKADLKILSAKKGKFMYEVLEELIENEINAVLKEGK